VCESTLRQRHISVTLLALGSCNLRDASCVSDHKHQEPVFHVSYVCSYISYADGIVGLACAAQANLGIAETEVIVRSMRTSRTNTTSSQACESLLCAAAEGRTLAMVLGICTRSDWDEDPACAWSDTTEHLQKTSRHGFEIDGITVLCVCYDRFQAALGLQMGDRHQRWRMAWRLQVRFLPWPAHIASIFRYCSFVTVLSERLTSGARQEGCASLASQFTRLTWFTMQPISSDVNSPVEAPYMLCVPTRLAQCVATTDIPLARALCLELQALIRLIQTYPSTRCLYPSHTLG